MVGGEHLGGQTRRDIDGLRALAVIPVVLFHSGIQSISGGFIGVDVFFVISGYLITSMIVDQVGRGTFSYWDFYERRARRILPALSIVLIVVLSGGLLLLLPDQLMSTSKAALSTVLLNANHYFYSTTNYFSDDAEVQPLIHMWSLSVEEQFYMVLPILLVILMPRTSRRTLIAIVFALCVGSLLLSEVVSLYKPTMAFYWLPFRAWELGIGSLLALGIMRQPKPLVANIISVGGICAIAAAMLTLTAQSRFPGFSALPPVLGAAAIIVAGPKAIGNRLLSLQPFVFVGLISYSLYLWHWPLIVAARQFYATVHMAPSTVAVVVVASFVAATLSWKYVEQPFRNRATFSRRTVFAAAGISSTFILTCASALAINGIPSRFTPAELRFAKGAKDYSPLGTSCINPGSNPGDCEFGAKDVKPSFAVWGDSHAAALLSAFEEAANETGLRGTYMGTNSCPPIPGVTIAKQGFSARQKCSAFNDAAMTFLEEDSDIQTVFLIGFWPYYLSDDRGAALLVDGRATPDKKSVLRDGLRTTIGRLRASGRDVVVLADLPWPKTNVPWHLALSDAFGRDRLTVNRAAPSAGATLELADAYYDMSEILCAADCRITEGGVPLFTDSHHLSVAGARIYVSTFVARLRASRPLN